MSILRKNITFNLFGQFLVALLGFISAKYIYSGLGEDALGIIYFSIAMSALFASALDMGLSKTTIREVATHEADNPDYIKRLLQTFSFLYWSAYFIVVIFLIILLPYIVGSWINLSTMSEDTAYVIILIICVPSLLSIPKTFMRSIFIGIQRMGVNNGIEVAMSIFQQAGMIILLMNKKDILTVSCWIASINVLRLALYLFFIFRLISIASMIPKFSIDVMRSIRNYASKTLLASLIIVIHKQLDKIIISKFMPIGVLGIYSLLYTSLGKTSLPTGAVSDAVFPVFTDLKRRKKRGNLIEMFFTLQNVLVFGTAPVYAAAFFFAFPLFTFVLDEAKATDLQPTVFLLSISFYLNAVLRLLRTYAFAIGKPEYVVRADLLSLFIVSPMAVLLIFKLGMNGAAIAWILFYVVCAVYIVPRIYRKELGRSWLDWFASVLKAVLLSCIIYIPAFFYVHVYYDGSLLVLLISYILSSFLYAVIAINIIEESMQKILVAYLPSISALIISKYSVDKQ